MNLSEKEKDVLEKVLTAVNEAMEPLENGGMMDDYHNFILTLDKNESKAFKNLLNIFEIKQNVD